MPKSKSLYFAAAPLALLLLLCAGSRLYANLADAPPTTSAEEPATPNATPYPPKPADADTQKKLEKAVSGQMVALRKKDYAGALHFSAPSFRASTTADYFGHVIETGYMPLTTSVRAEYRPAQTRGELAILPATVIAKDGTKTKYLYILEKEASGWFIEACQGQPEVSRPTVTDEREI